MKVLHRILLLSALLLSVCGPAKSALTYDVSWGSPNFGVTGSITTDGTIGVLSANNIIYWSFVTITEPQYIYPFSGTFSSSSPGANIAVATYSPFNGYDSCAACLNASATELSVLSQTTPFLINFISFNSPSGAGNSVFFSSGYFGFGVSIGDNTGSSVTVGTASPEATSFAVVPSVVPPPSAVPLPAAAWLLIAGIGTLGAAARRRKGA